MISLRDYQSEGVVTTIEEMRKEPTSLVVASTGLGKTRMYIATIGRLLSINPNLRIIVLVNKIKLLEQSLENFNTLLPHISAKMYCGSLGLKDTNTPVLFATVQSVTKIKEHYDIIILDEIHNVDQSAGRYMTFINNAQEINPKVRIAAYTATPFRSDGYIFGKDKLFKRICFQRDLKWAIKNKYLVPPRVKHTKEQIDTSKLHIRMGDWKKSEVEALTSDQQKLSKQLSDAIPKLVDRKSVVWSCSSIRHATDVYNQLVKNNELTSIVHSKQTKQEAQDNLTSFEQGDTRHLVFVSIVSEGIDIPRIDAVVLMRPTRSPVLMVQTIGRGLRPYKGKKDCLVLDYGNVIEHCGPIDKPIVSTPTSKKNTTPAVIPMKFCNSCYEYVHVNIKICPACNSKIGFTNTASYQTNLTTKASKRNPLNAPMELKVTSARMQEHVSKAGNKCLKIIYHTNSLAHYTVTEYIPDTGEHWSDNKIKERKDMLLNKPLTGLHITIEEGTRWTKVKKLHRKQ